MEDETMRKLCVQDFQKNGVLSEVKIPFHGPIPVEILEYVFGEKNVRLSEEFEMNYLQHIHKLRGLRTEICECGNHLLDCGSYINVVFPDAEIDETTAGMDNSSQCDCDVQ
jgi:hypothetical protein